MIMKVFIGKFLEKQDFRTKKLMNMPIKYKIPTDL